MSTRRNVLIGGMCLAGAGASYAMTPRRRVSLIGQARLSSLAPSRFGSWTSRDVSDLVAPATDGSLMSKLYAQTVERIYSKNGSEPEVMMLLAEGNAQTNDLQLHRPEVCYQAFGFHLLVNHPTQLKIDGHSAIPGRQIVAQAQDRQENILYWTRMGEYLPDSGTQQRLDRVKLALHGDIADGLLARFSAVGQDSANAFNTLRGFIPAFLKAVPPNSRAALIGTRGAHSLETDAAMLSTL